MSNLIDYAKRELDLIGMSEDTDDDMNYHMRKHILKMVSEFSEEGHTGASAAYALSILTKLLDFKPLTPLTGEDDEWTEVSNSAYMKYQNKRCFHVFKGEDGRAYDSEGKIFYDYYTGEDGRQHKSHYTNSESRVYIEFPYVPMKEYLYRKSGA